MKFSRFRYRTAKQKTSNLASKLISCFDIYYNLIEVDGVNVESIVRLGLPEKLND